MKKSLILLYFLQSIYSYSQIPIGIGDKLPSFDVELVNYKMAYLNLSSLKGKALILDFWATWCSPCVNAFRKMDSLQKEFDSDLLILPVTYQDKNTIQTFLNDQREIMGFKLPSIVNDQKLNQTFPHMEIPHYVWIDKDGIVRYITYSEAVTAELVSKFILGQNLEMELKNDKIRDLHSSSSSLSNEVTLLGSLGVEKFSEVLNNTGDIYSFHMLSGYIPGQGGLYTGSDSCVAFQNVALPVLYAVCFDKGGLTYMGPLGTNMDLVTKDSTKFTNTAGLGQKSTKYQRDWLSVSGHCYSYVLKKSKIDTSDIWEIMKKDLSENFPFIRTSIEQKLKYALVLKQIGQGRKFQSITTGSSNGHLDTYNANMENVPIESLRLMIGRRYQNYRVINETGYDGLINITLRGNLNNLEILNEQLKEYDLVLEKEYRSMRVLMIHDIRNL